MEPRESDNASPNSHIGKRKIEVMTWNMSEYLQGIVDDYCKLYRSLSGKELHLKGAPTPFLEDDPHLAPARAPEGIGPAVTCPWCKHTFPESSGREVKCDKKATEAKSHIKADMSSSAQDSEDADPAAVCQEIDSAIAQKLVDTLVLVAPFPVPRGTSLLPINGRQVKTRANLSRL